MMVENPACMSEEIAALHEGIALGISLIDTTEMFGEVPAKTLVSKTIA